MDFYFLNRRELDKNEIDGKAMSVLTAFIKVSNLESKERSYIIPDYKQLKKIKEKKESSTKKTVILDLLNKGYKPKQIAEITGYDYRLVEAYRCNYTTIRYRANKDFKRIMICLLCGKAKEVYTSRIRAKYCSHACRNKAKKLKAKGKVK